VWTTSVETKARVVGLSQDTVSWSCDEGGEKDWMRAFVQLGLLVGNTRIITVVLPGIYTFCSSFMVVTDGK